MRVSWLYVNGPRHVLVTLDSEASVAALRPDLGALTRVPGAQCVNCFAGAGNRWKTRMFAPALGISEDPATGSAAGPLALHLARHGRIAFGEEIRIAQGAEIGRPSLLFARAEGSASASPASRSAAPSSWSGAASSACPPEAALSPDSHA